MQVPTRAQEVQMQEDITISDISSVPEPLPLLKKESLKYTCLDCEYKTKTKSHMDKHVKDIHKPEEKDINFICGICQHIFLEEDDYNLHVKVHDDPKETEVSNVISASTVEVVTEERLLDKSGEEVVPTLQEEIQNKENIVVLENRCTKCNKIIRTEIGLNRHEELFCKICKECQNDRISFDIHMRMNHHHTNHFKCNKCEEVFNMTVDLEWHQETQHVEILKEVAVDKNQEELKQKVSQCHECKETLDTEEALGRHMILHHPGVKCHECDEVFLNSLQLNRHI